MTNKKNTMAETLKWLEAAPIKTIEEWLEVIRHIDQLNLKPEEVALLQTAAVMKRYVLLLDVI